MAVLAALFDFQQSGLTHDPQMFGDVVLGHFQPLRDCVHTQRLFEQQAKHAQTGFLPQRFQGRDAVESGHAQLIQPRKLFMQAAVGSQFR